MESVIKNVRGGGGGVTIAIVKKLIVLTELFMKLEFLKILLLIVPRRVIVF